MISSSSAQHTAAGNNYNGHGFWDQQLNLDGVSYNAPFGSELAQDPAPFVDYIHFPVELAEVVTDGTSVERVMRIFIKRSSNLCTPVITDARIVVYRYTH